MAYERSISDWSSDVCSSDLRQILGLLQDDGRMTNVELAERVGLTAPPCLRHVRALEEAGAIKGYHAELDPPALGYPITVFAMVSLKSQAERDLSEFQQRKTTVTGKDGSIRRNQ